MSTTFSYHLKRMEMLTGKKVHKINGLIRNIQYFSGTVA